MPERQVLINKILNNLYDDLNNRYGYPIDEDEKHCFETEWDDDFIIINR